jgi:hypothetical protein
MFRIMTVLAACALCQSLEAQTIYKCNAGGKLAYGDRPCADGESVALPPAPPPVATGPDTSLREHQALARLESLRLAREQREARDNERVRRTEAARYQKCARLRLHLKWAKEDQARADGARLETARRKARRQAETLAVECPG